jgi:rubredoxin
MGVFENAEAMEATGKIDQDDRETHGGDDEEEAPSLSEQRIPSNTTCPYCGAEPTGDSKVKHQLSAVGYLHDDIHLECSECDEKWACGVPIGQVDDGYNEDLYCDSCTDRYMQIHRLQVDFKGMAERLRQIEEESGVASINHMERDELAEKINPLLTIHLKCPNCYYFKKISRTFDDRGVALMGFPEITGSREGASEYGWKVENRRP